MDKLCNICPRNCNVDRISKLGYCKSTNTMKIAKVMLHYFEEPLISGSDELGNISNGSGAIFFSNCNLGCIYCQNSDISSHGLGKEISTDDLISIFKQLEDAGANNINLVTPTHFTLQILKALKIYKPKIPIVWNTSGYEKPETIFLLKDYVDIFLTDIKYLNEKSAQKYSFAKNYPEFVKKSTLEMRKIIPNDVIENGLMKKGIIIRHLVLPNQTKDSLDVINWIYENLGNKTYLSLMSQYTPVFNANKYDEINRKITPLEYKVLINHLNKLEFKNVFLQDFSSADSCFTPDFQSEEKTFKY